MEIHFTAADLSRVSVAITMGPIAETVFALALLGRPGSVVYEDWRAQVHRAVGGRRAALGAMTRTFRPVPDLLWLLGPPSDTDERLLASAGHSRQEVAAVVQDFCRLAVAPYWGRVRRYLGAEQEALGRILTSGGVEQLLAVVHPRARWEAPILRLPLEPARDVSLGGRGLVITPSLFLGTASCVLVKAADRSGRCTLVCPTPPSRANAKHLWDGAGRTGEALAALVGRTRAGLLYALTESRSTSELAQQLGISTAAASQHTAVLRQAGLITTRRNHISVLHTLTSLGAALLGAGAAPATSRYEKAMLADPDGGLFAS
jgi:DNA-binding transcriptional ArsR family regulator